MADTDIRCHGACSGCSVMCNSNY